MPHLITLNTALSASTAGTGRIQIFPDGTFYAKDNRFPKGWTLTKETATVLINTANARKDDYMVDYEHQAILSGQNGKPAPAAGWFKAMEYIEGEGLFADVKWTQTASESIKKDEYRYISPTFKTDNTGAILSLFNVALTNTPAIDGMSNVVSLKEDLESESKIESLASRADFATELKALLKLDDSLNDDQIIGAVKEMIRQVEYLKENPASNANSNPDPSQFVPLSALTDVQTQLSGALSREKDREINMLIESAKAEGKIVPATEKWARDYATKDLAGAKEYLTNVAKVVALNETQTSGTSPIFDTNISLTESEKTAAFELGLSFDEYVKAKQTLEY